MILDPDLEFVEDGDWAMITKISVHASTIIDNYYDLFNRKTSDIDQLEAPERFRYRLDQFLYTQRFIVQKIQIHIEIDLIEVIKVYWKSRKSSRLLIIYMDPQTGRYGKNKKLMMDLKCPQNIKNMEQLNQNGLWVNEVWEGTKIDDSIFM